MQNNRVNNSSVGEIYIRNNVTTIDIKEGRKKSNKGEGSPERDIQRSDNNNNNNKIITCIGLVIDKAKFEI